jgi:hypothetical protein
MRDLLKLQMFTQNMRADGGVGGGIGAQAQAQAQARAQAQAQAQAQSEHASHSTGAGWTGWRTTWCCVVMRRSRMTRVKW